MVKRGWSRLPAYENTVPCGLLFVSGEVSASACFWSFIRRTNAGGAVVEDQVRSVCNVRPAVRLLQLGFGRYGPAAPYLCCCTLSNPFSNWVTSGVSPDSRPPRPMTRQR